LDSNLYVIAFLGDIGMVYGRLAQYQKALKYYEQTLIVVRGIDGKSGENTFFTGVSATSEGA
jgi:hypothetical protein